MVTPIRFIRVYLEENQLQQQLSSLYSRLFISVFGDMTRKYMNTKRTSKGRQQQTPFHLPNGYISSYSQKWDQKSMNMYFSIILGNHICSIFMPMAYYPSIFSSIIAYIHLFCFCGMLINTICIKQKEIGKGGRTKTNRVFWISNIYLIIVMCILNLILIVSGLQAVPNIFQ